MQVIKGRRAYRAQGVRETSRRKGSSAEKRMEGMVGGAFQAETQASQITQVFEHRRLKWGDVEKFRGRER